MAIFSPLFFLWAVVGGLRVVDPDHYLAALAAALEGIHQFNLKFEADHGRPPEADDPLPDWPDQSLSTDDFVEALRETISESEGLAAA